jgi:type VI secretion system protein ImpA
MKIAGLELAELAAAVSEAEPCGPDLELTDDPVYLNFMASAEGLLPASYFEFNRTGFDFEAQYASVAQLLARSRDLRLLTVLAKLLLLNRDLDGFAASIDSMATLLQDRWDLVHPGAGDAGVDARLAPVRALNDYPLIALVLHYQPLLVSKRSGAITYRSYMVATGQASPRAGEDVVDLPTIERELEEAELDKLKDMHGKLMALHTGFSRIQSISLERAGGDAVDLKEVEPLVGKMGALLEGVILKRDPSAVAAPHGDAASTGEATAAAEAGAPAPQRRGRVGSVAEAAAALAAVAEYFSRLEPSSPALLLTRQAQALIGKSFVEVMQILVPGKVEAATFQIGGEQALALPLQSLIGLAGQPEDATAETAGRSR